MGLRTGTLTASRGLEDVRDVGRILATLDRVGPAVDVVVSDGVEFRLRGEATKVALHGSDGCFSSLLPHEGDGVLQRFHLTAQLALVRGRSST